jgi:ABC-2 type transport system permease protein
MISRSLVEMCKARMREFRREPSAFFWVIFMPIVWMLILGYSFSEPRTEIFGIVTIGERSSHLLADSDRAFGVEILRADDLHTAEKLMRRGDAVLGVEQTDTHGIRFILDETNPQANRARIIANDVIQQRLGRVDAIKTESLASSLRSSRYVDFLIPGLLGLSIMTSSLFGLGMTLVSNRKENLLKRYLATPMSRSEYLLSHMFGRFIVFLYEATSVLAAAWLLFGFEVSGNFLSFGIFALLGVACFSSIALLCASRTSSIPAMGAIINLVNLPMMLLSGVFFATSNLPSWLQSVTSFLPLTSLVNGLRLLALEGAGVAALTPHIYLLLAYTILCGFAAKQLFRWY